MPAWSEAKNAVKLDRERLLSETKGFFEEMDSPSRRLLFLPVFEKVSIFSLLDAIAADGFAFF